MVGGWVDGRGEGRVGACALARSPPPPAPSSLPLPSQSPTFIVSWGFLRFRPVMVTPRNQT
jgi:hypothetical protein